MTSRSLVGAGAVSAGGVLAACAIAFSVNDAANCKPPAWAAFSD